MCKAAVIIYSTVVLLILYLISYSPKTPPVQRYRRLKLRSNFTFPIRGGGGGGGSGSGRHRKPVAFDPLVAEMERRRADKEWERRYFEYTRNESVEAPGEEPQPEWEDFMNAEDYLNDDEKFNVTNRLVLLFPDIDIDPVDGFVTESELMEWNLRQTEKEVTHRSEREMEVYDKNHDGFVSFAEYDPPGWVKNSANNSFYYDMGWWKEEHFNASDADEDGLLNQTEFKDFMHPADSNNPKLLQWLCKEEIWERDSDKDGKINFKDFFHGLFDMIRNYDEESQNSSFHSDSMESPAKMLFAQIDQDGDGLIWIKMGA
ncbi:PREDICTED: reticulocalbin-2-like isoform X1 [Nelumbo nucifera]|uniref:Reticulocalbin-2-like isoform X1 n=1 Tax=Nelumbo nucifera TaxID=4432 RepID=A0A1U7ZL07_NELNU|nr:PREDICTED: reticulocalbin-2-like isoform X1 [Nelumbo nucifera]